MDFLPPAFLRTFLFLLLIISFSYIVIASLSSGSFLFLKIVCIPLSSPSLSYLPFIARCCRQPLQLAPSPSTLWRTPWFSLWSTNLGPDSTGIFIFHPNWSLRNIQYQWSLPRSRNSLSLAWVTGPAFSCFILFCFVYFFLTILPDPFSFPRLLIFGYW